LPLDAMRRVDCSGLDDVESTLADFYRSRGFQNVKVHPLVQPNKASEQFDLTLYIDEGK
jgi:outer membrane protein assembly factor BamA